MGHLEEPQENQFKEIDILDFIRIIKKRKKIIFGFFLIGLVSGMAWFFLAPSSYRGTIILKIGGFIEETGKRGIDYFENINEVVEGIKKGVYGDYPKPEVVNPSSTNIIEISLTAESRDKAEEFLKTIKADVLSAHEQKVESRKQAIDQEINFLKNKIENLKKDAFFFMARGEQIAFLQLEIYNTEKLISGLEKEKANILMSQVMRGPDVTEKRPNYLTIFFAATLGLFIGLILAFFIDWLERNQKRI